jgi:putative nucleotidyltransferase with HDIG domain
VDAALADRPVVRLAALLHDIGKPSTLADGHFPHHDAVGAELAGALLRRLRYPRSAADEIVHLIRHHMFQVDQALSDAAVRRFIRRIGADRLDALFALRAADDTGSGADPADPETAAFRARIDAEVATNSALDRFALAIGGTDLMAELNLEPGPRLGHLIDALVERVITDPELNERGSLLLLAQGILADMYEDAADR